MLKGYYFTRGYFLGLVYLQFGMDDLVDSACSVSFYSATVAISVGQTY